MRERLLEASRLKKMWTRVMREKEYNLLGDTIYFLNTELTIFSTFLATIRESLIQGFTDQNRSVQNQPETDQRGLSWIPDQLLDRTLWHTTLVLFDYTSHADCIVVYEYLNKIQSKRLYLRFDENPRRKSSRKLTTNEPVEIPKGEGIYLCSVHKANDLFKLSHFWNIKTWT